MVYAGEINHIRQFYPEQSSQIAPYLLLSANDDQQGMLAKWLLVPRPGSCS
jgi:hypothetical protein